jgi:hypothetical protein
LSEVNGIDIVCNGDANCTRRGNHFRPDGISDAVQSPLDNLKVEWVERVFGLDVIAPPWFWELPAGALSTALK